MQRNKHLLQTIFAALLIFAALAATAQAPKVTPAALPKCTATTQAGNPCKNYAYKTAATCYIHTPDIATAPRSTCNATTASGGTCKARTAPGSKCHNHDDSADVIRCGATTTKGTPCTRPVKSVGEKCHQHKTKETK
jgi:hypothetical protein